MDYSNTGCGVFKRGVQNYKGLAPMAIEKIKLLGAVLELTAKQHCQFSPFGPIFEVNGLDWQCYLAGPPKRPPEF